MNDQQKHHAHKALNAMRRIQNDLAQVRVRHVDGQLSNRECRGIVYHIVTLQKFTDDVVDRLEKVVDGDCALVEHWPDPVHL